MKRLLKPILCGVLALLILVSPMFGAARVSAASEVTSSTKPYVIAVVYDNSGSMYQAGRTYWCQAKFSMEIFASMLNYENGDKLVIFPMGTVTTDGKKTQSRDSADPIEINGLDDLQIINNLYTVNCINTPYEPVKEASDYLDGFDSSKYEKWLVVLTDGEFNAEERDDPQGPTIDMGERLTALASPDKKVFYLGFGNAQNNFDSDVSKGLYVEKNTKKSLNTRLVNVCNTIFERDELKDLSGEKLTFGLSMRKVLVYVQGEGSSIDSLTDSSGKTVSPFSDSGQRKFSTLASLIEELDDVTIVVDESLAGQVVTYTNCPAGEYTLDYELAKGGSVQVFYEPAVDVSVTVKDHDGNVVDLTAGKVNTGHYTVDYCIVDAMTDEDVTDSPLLKVENLGAWLELSDGTRIPVENGQEIQFPVDDELDLVVEGDYLGKYHISTKDSPDKFPPVKVVLPKEQKLTLDASTKQVSNWFLESDHDKWNPIILKVKLDGEELTDEQMKALDLDLDIKDDITYTCKVLEGQSAYEVRIGYNEKGEYVQPAYGTYKLSAKVSMTDKYDRPIKDSDTLSFDVQPYSVVWTWLAWVLGLIALGLIITVIGKQKVLPKKIFIEFEDGTRVNITPTGSKKRSRIMLSSSEFGEIIVGEAVATTDLFKRGSSGARFEFVNMSSPPKGAKRGVKKFTINGEQYDYVERNNGFIEHGNAGAGKVQLSDLKFDIGNSCDVCWTHMTPTGLKTRNGTILINPRN